MNERIKKLRKALDLTQQKFADRIGSTQNVLANYETGRRNPSSSVINNICKTFNVSEKWLRTGEGEMFTNEPDTVLDALAAKYGLSTSARALVEEFVNLPPDIQQAFVDYALKAARAIANDEDAAVLPKPSAPAIAQQNQLSELVNKPAVSDDEDEADEYDPELEAEVAEFRRQRRIEKRNETSPFSRYGNVG